MDTTKQSATISVRLLACRMPFCFARAWGAWGLSAFLVSSKLLLRAREKTDSINTAGRETLYEREAIT